MYTKGRSNLSQVRDISDEAARLIEGTVIRVFTQSRTAQVRLDGSPQYTIINLGSIDPSLVAVDGSRILVYHRGIDYYAVNVIPAVPGSSPGITLGDSRGATKFSIYDSTQTEVAYIDSDGTISGTFDVPNHASDHITGGDDEIDGDKLDIDWTPSNYTPVTTPSEADNVDNLTAHLYGIDAALGGIGTDDKRVKVSTDDTTPGFLEDKFVVSHGTNSANPLELSTLSGGGDEDRQLQFDEAKVDHDGLLNFVSNEHINHTSVTLTAGAGLSGGGDISANRTFTVGEGTGITVNADTIQTNDGEIVHDNLSGFVGNEHIDHTGVTLTAGDGLTGGGDISASRTFAVGAGDGIDVAADAVAVDVTDILGNGLGETSNNIYVYQLRQSDDGDVALSADAAGDMTAYGSITFDTAESIATNSGNLTITPAGDIIFDPTGNDVLPETNYDINLGSLSVKFLTLHAAELWVETLVAQDTLATIGGRILVGPTTTLADDIADSITNVCENESFETVGTGGSDVFANWGEVINDGTISQDGTIYYTGSYSCKIVEGATTGNDRVWQAESGLTPGDNYSLHFACRGDGTYSGRYSVWDNTNGAYIITITETGHTAASWTEQQVSFTLPALCTEIIWRLYGPSTGGGTAWWDDVWVYRETIDVEHNQMADGDIAYMEANGKIEFFEILGGPTGSGPYTYEVARNLDFTGLNAWYAGDAVFNTGAADDGFIDLYSVAGVDSNGTGPTIVGNVRNSSTYNDWTEHWAIGNLNGVYGYDVDTYGVGLGGYSEGDYITIDPTNGIRFLDSSDNIQGQLSSAAWTLGQVGASLSNVHITAGALQMRTNEVVHAELTTAGTFWVGDTSSTERLQWDATNGLVIYNASNAAVLKAPTTGDIQIVGTLDVISPGEITAAGGAVILDENGITIDIESTEGYEYIQWTDGSNVTGWISSFGTYNSDVQTNVSTFGGSGDALVLLHAFGNSGGHTTVQVDQNSSNPFVTLTAGNEACALQLSYNDGVVTTEDFTYYGDLYSHKTSSYDVYAFHPLTEPLTNTSFDGDSFSSVSSHTKIENTSWSTTVPADAKALVIRATIRDSGSAGNTSVRVELYATSTATNPAFASRCGGIANDSYSEAQGIVPCTDGDVWYRCAASGTGTLDIWLQVVGYFI